MSTFDEAKHEREKTGKFAPKAHKPVVDTMSLTDGSTDDLPPPLVEAELRTQNAAIYSLLDFDKEDGDNYDFDAPYQRGHAWEDDRKRNLIRSVQMGIPIGAITLSEHRERPNKWQVIVDGKQRVTALRDFHEDRLAVPGHWFHADDLKDPAMRAEDVRFSDLNSRGQRGFTGSTISISRFTPQNVSAGGSAYRTSAEDADQQEANLYLLINTGGIDHTEDDLARAKEVADS